MTDPKHKNLLSRIKIAHAIRALLRRAFRYGEQISPETATKAAAWLFTRTRRAREFPGEALLLTQARSQILRHQGRDLVVMEWGRGPAVLCAHGWSSRALRFRALIERLVKSGFRVVALDAPGHGQSSGRHTDVIEYAEAIRVVADNAGDLHGAVGHSFGAMALLLALEKGLKVRKVVFFSALNGMRGPLDFLGKQLDFSVPLLQAVKVSFEKKFCRSLESLEAVNIIPQLQTPPLLIIHDKYDPVLPFHNAVDLARVWKNSGLLTTHGMGHVGNLDALTPINKVLDFLVAPGD